MAVIAPQACLHTVSTTVPSSTTNTCGSGCDCCSFGHNGACPVDESGTADCHTSYHGPTGFQVRGNRGPCATQPRPRAPMQASAAPTRRPVPWTPSPSPSTLRWSCGAWKWSLRAHPPPTLAETVMVVAMLLLGPMTGRGGCTLPPTQTKALMELYNATNGRSWRGSQGWMAGDPCTGSWVGVGCNPDGAAVVYVHACEVASMPHWHITWPFCDCVPWSHGVCMRPHHHIQLC
jgi:hypothetical protein